MKESNVFLVERSSAVLEYGGFSVIILGNPRVVFAEADACGLVDDIVDEVQIVSAESFGVELKNKSREGIKNHVISVDSLALLYQGDNIAGFASAKHFSLDDVFFLHGIAVSPNAKGRGAGAFLAKSLIRHVNLHRVSFTTQNPFMFCLLRSITARIFPSPQEPDVPFRLYDLGEKLINGRRGSFNPSTFVIKGLYNGCLYSSIPASRDSAVNDWFTASLNIVDGITRDGFLFIGEGY